MAKDQMKGSNSNSSQRQLAIPDNRDARTEDDEIDAYIFTKEWQKHNLEENEESSDDDFENEMNAELDNRIDDLYGQTKTDDANLTEAEKKARAQEEENDQLLYDPDEDDEDEKWVNDHMRPYAAKKANNNRARPKPSANSDAILNCPACISLLCLDCQRHEIYTTQYRAMFVQNCIIDHNEKRSYIEKKGSKRKANNRSFDRNETQDYSVVRCQVCNTEVAVYEDAEEIYHFHNVLSSF